MENGDGAKHALAEALGMVVEEAVGKAVKPLEKRLDSIERRLESVESEIHEIHELVQIPETLERKALIGQNVGQRE